MSRQNTDVGYQPQPMQLVFHLCPADEVLYGGAAGGGKALTLDTPLPTPTGWTTMGDVATGDVLFDEHGQPCTVTHVFDVIEQPDLYRITFDDGATVDACADHRWLTFDAQQLSQLTRRDPAWRARRQERRASRATGNKSAAFVAAMQARNATHRPATLPAPTGTVRRTVDLAQTVRTASGRANHAIPVAAALDLPDATLPIDPYILGVWLGDGTSAGGGFTTADEPIVGAMQDAGYQPRSYDHSAYGYGTIGLATQLRSVQVLNNKHIPVEYLRASRAQRLELLRGLMDTDGTVNHRSGAVEFCNTNAQLAQDVYELVLSLGWKVALRESRARLYGRDCGPKWTLKWTASEYVFRLERKRALQQLATRRTTRFRYIVDVTPIAPAPARCIAVDSPSHLFLAGRQMVPTHNSEALINEAIATCMSEPNTRACIFRRTSPELQELIDRAQEILAAVSAKIATYNAHLNRWTFGNGSILRFAHLQYYSDVLKHQGQQYTLLLFDEGTHFLESQVNYLRSRNRTPHEGAWARLLMASNPGSIGHVHVKDYFVRPRDERGVEITNAQLLQYWDFTEECWKPVRQTDTLSDAEARVRPDDPTKMYWHPFPPSRRGRPGPYVVWRPELTTLEITANEERKALGEVPLTPLTRCFIPARLQHNRYLFKDGHYQARLLRLPDKERKALLDGDWDIFEGQFFSEFRRPVHVIEHSWTPPATWRKWRSVDWGRADPLAFHWHAQNPENQHIVTYRELYGPGKSDREACREVLSLTPDHEYIDFTMADPSMWRGDGNDEALSHADIYETNGVKLQKATNDRVTGWTRMHDLLAIDPRTVPDDDPHGGVPFWQITANCTNLIRQLEQAVYDEDNKEDLDTDQEDHALDSARYGLMASQSMKARRRKVNFAAAGYAH